MYCNGASCENLGMFSLLDFKGTSGDNGTVGIVQLGIAVAHRPLLWIVKWLEPLGMLGAN